MIFNICCRECKRISFSTLTYPPCVLKTCDRRVNHGHGHHHHLLLPVHPFVYVVNAMIVESVSAAVPVVVQARVVVVLRIRMIGSYGLLVGLNLNH